MFQPVGGMDMIGKAFAREVGDLIRYDAKVTRIAQDDDGVTVTYVDAKAPAAASRRKPTGASAPFRSPFSARSRSTSAPA